MVPLVPPPAPRRAVLPVLVFLLGCAPALRFPGPLRAVGAQAPAAYDHIPPPPGLDAPEAPRRASDYGDSLASAAEHYLRHRPRGFRDDCSGFVEAVTARAGWPLSGSTASLWSQAKAAGHLHRRKTPRPGDLAFFDNTHDRNGNGRLDDELTHVAVVLAVEPDGTIRLAHAGTSAGRAELRMNLQHPELHRGASGVELNGYLRRRRADDKPRTGYLAGELWRGFATLEPGDRVTDS